MFGQYKDTLQQIQPSGIKAATQWGRQEAPPFLKKTNGTGGGLFCSVGDNIDDSLINTKRSDLAAAATAAANPSTLLPFEGRITINPNTNKLPAFFAGAQQERVSPRTTTATATASSSSLLPTAALKTESQPVNNDTLTESASAPMKSLSSSEMANEELDKKDATASTTSEESTTIKVFGFPSHMVDQIKKHFANYGNIVEIRHSPGNWLTLRYEKSTSATSALKSNRRIIADTYMIGVILIKGEDQRPLSPAIDTFKSVQPSTNIQQANSNNMKKKLDGVSVLGSPTVRNNSYNGNVNIPQTSGWIGFIKDALFAW